MKILEINTNGYPQLLKYSRALGGYSSGGYIGYDNALNFHLKTERPICYRNI